MHSQLMTVAGVAQLLTVHPQTVLARVHAGVIPGARIGAQWRFWRPTMLARAVGDEAAKQMLAVEGYSPADDPEVVTPTELADLLGVNLSTVRTALNSGAIPAGRVGRRWQIYWPLIRDAIAAGAPLGPGHEPPSPRE